VPDVPGVNCTPTVHDALIATLPDEGHGKSPDVTIAKSPAFAPVKAMPVKSSAALPLFVNVAICTELFVPTAMLPKFIVAG